MSQVIRSLARASARAVFNPRASNVVFRSVASNNALKFATRARFYSDKPNKPSSLLSDDILEKAGMEVNSQSSKASAETSESTESSSSSTESSTEGHTTEEQRQRWKGTAKKASNKTTKDLHREKLSNYFYVAALGAALGGSIYLARDWDNEEEQNRHPDIGNGMSASLLWGRFSARIGDLFGYFNEPVFEELLPDPLPAPYGRPFTLVLGLDDVLVHSEWSRQYGWRTAKRPGLDYFLGYLAQYYEIVVFSSNYMMNSEKIIPKLDPYRASISHALYRESTTYRDGKIIKDLGRMNRDIGKIIMVDCSPDSAALQPENAIILKPWEGNADDKELVKLIPFLEWLATQPIKDVRPILKSYEGTYIPDEYSRREAIVRKKFEEEWQAEQAQRQKNNWAAQFLGIKPPTQTAPMMPQDYIRQEGQKGYLQFQKYVEEHGEEFLAEEKAREQQIMNEQKLTLNKLVTQGLPTPEEIQAAAAAAEANNKQ